MRKKASVLILSSSFILSAAVSCGKDDQTYTPITPDIVAFVKTICGAAFKCCTQGEVGWYIGTFLTAENCTERLSEAVSVEPVASFDATQLVGEQPTGELASLSVLVPNLGALDRAVRDGRTVVDAGALAGCEKFLRGVQCNAPAPKATSKDCKALPEPPPPGACDPKKIYIGTLQEGAPCTSDGRSFECGPGLICVRNGALGETGQCVREGKEGDYCLEDATCAEGLYCSMLDGTCRAPRKPGETCEYADHLSTTPDPNTLLVKCRADLECDPVTELCVPRCQEGHSCASDDDCAQPQDAPLKCISGRCDTPRAEGLPCVVDANCQDSLYCGDNPAKPGKQACRAREPDGTACTPSGFGSGSVSRQCSGFCDPTKDQCAPQLPPGSPCPAGIDDQCDHGYCSLGGYCSTDADCTGSTCDTLTFQCKRVCIASKPEGAPCTESNECAPLQCIANFCRDLPLGPGVECNSNSQCETNFCNLDTPRVCQDLPLEAGSKCNADSQCMTLVCFGDSSLNQTCTQGRQEGELCGNSLLPCDPHSFYCDTTLDQPRCTRYLETGAECSRAEQCRSGECTAHMQRKLCSPAAAPEKAICDGE
jgi:hypothetical protein